eukprot:UN02217
MWTVHASCLIAPYEVLIYELSADDLLNAQELNHAAIQTAWNKWIEKELGFKAWSYWQIKVWKYIMFDVLKPQSIKLNLAIGVALEALFCWLVYLQSMFNGLIAKRMSPKTWVWAFHLLEEVEHTHISVPEMRKDLSTPIRFAVWFIFDVFVVVPLLIIVVPITCAKHFPGRCFSFRGFQELIEYYIFCVCAVLFSGLGQFCELVLCLNWKKSALESLWKNR